jgi:hypothetical protein
MGSVCGHPNDVRIENGPSYILADNYGNFRRIHSWIYASISGRFCGVRNTQDALVACRVMLTKVQGSATKLELGKMCVRSNQRNVARPHCQ